MLISSRCVKRLFVCLFLNLVGVLSEMYVFIVWKRSMWKVRDFGWMLQLVSDGGSIAMISVSRSGGFNVYHGSEHPSLVGDVFGSHTVLGDRNQALRIAEQGVVRDYVCYKLSFLNEKLGVGIPVHVVWDFLL